MKNERRNGKSSTFRTLSEASAVELIPKMEVGVNNSIDEKLRNKTGWRPRDISLTRFWEFD